MSEKSGCGVQRLNGTEEAMGAAELDAEWRWIDLGGAASSGRWEELMDREAERATQFTNI